MRKCYNCDDTKNLKSIFVEACDCHLDYETKPDYHSVCYECFFSDCACDYETHTASECLKDSTCPNHERTKKFKAYWNDYNWNWKLKKK